MCMRLLKHWILLGRDVPTKAEHFKLYESTVEVDWKNGRLPEMSALDAAVRKRRRA